MQIQHMSYDENFAGALASLEEFYADALEESDTTQTASVSPYAATDNKISLVAVDGEEVTGRLCGSYDPLTNSARIEMLFVNAVQRGRNIGGQLVASFEQTARENGVQMLFVDTTSLSSPRFYEKQGFTLIGSIEDYPVAGETYILMRKRLSV